MKNKFWLMPFSVLYLVITEIRNFLFKIGIFSRTSTQVFSIGIGNLQVGGTGKTPLALYLLQTFQNIPLGIIARGYKRTTRGLYEYAAGSTPAELGDELFMLAQKAPKGTPVLADGNRRRALIAMESKLPKNGVIVFDDVFQHQYVKPTLLILVTPAEELFTEDWLLPVGRLRERRTNALRADAVVVTNYRNQSKEFIRSSIAGYTKPGTPIFFSKVTYGIPTPIIAGNTPRSEWVAFAGLGRPQAFFKQVSVVLDVKKQIAFQDHHSYSISDLKKLLEDYPNAQFITTEKDMVKLTSFSREVDLSAFFYLPMEISFEHEADFGNFVSSSYQQFIQTIS